MSNSKISRILNSACKKGDLKSVKHYLKNKSIVNNKFGSGLFLLGGAVVGGHVKIVRYLLKKGAKINMRSNYAWTPLFTAAQRGFTDVADVLIKNNALLNVLTKSGFNSPDKYTPLHIASEKGHSAIVKSLVEAGAKINRKNGSGETPFDISVKYRRYKIACYLALNGGPFVGEYCNSGQNYIADRYPLVLILDRRRVLACFSATYKHETIC